MKKLNILLIILTVLLLNLNIIEAQDTLTVNFSGMTPHIGQNLYLRVVDQADETEIGRVKTAVGSAAFSVSIGGISTSGSYNVDFFADHNKNGKYDAPPADHAWRITVNDLVGDSIVPFVHNTTFTNIEWSHALTIAFSNMTPHLTQNLYLALIDKDSGHEVERKKMNISAANFDVMFNGVMPGTSYDIDFFADHNKNGKYDAPPADHAWRITVNDLVGDSIVPFVHNTTFTNIEWSHALTIAFSNMTPHLTQNLYLALIDKDSGHEVERKKMNISAANFDVMFNGVMPGTSYDIDFFADHNKNGKYDAPPADHAWRITVNDLVGDSIVPFVHNTTFTNIEWSHALTIAFSNMTPHLSQNLYLALIDKDSGHEVERKKMNISAANFDVMFNGVMPGTSYDIDFFADHNKNGKYDAPPADHAWRITVNDLVGDSIVPFVHNTTFTNIEWSHALTIAFSNMTPHLTQNLYLALIDKDSGHEVERKKMDITTANFDVMFNGVMPGTSYDIDFFADHNKNGKYDAPPADHAWRITVNDLVGDSIVPFVHNTTFTNIEWQYLLTVNFMGFTPHLGQLFGFYVTHSDHEIIDSTLINPITDANFSVTSYVIEPDMDYLIDFYSDLNGNGHYDAPPADHAWRIELSDVAGDTVLNFEHNTTFTDIRPEPTGIETAWNEFKAELYPNPVINHLMLTFEKSDEELVKIQIYNSSGRLLIENMQALNNGKVFINLEDITPGLYFLNVTGENFRNKFKFVKE